jgi:hypothetical protein
MKTLGAAAQLSSSLFLTVTFDRDLSPMMRLSCPLRASKLALWAPGLRGFQPRGVELGWDGAGRPSRAAQAAISVVQPQPYSTTANGNQYGAWPYVRGAKVALNLRHRAYIHTGASPTLAVC